MSGGYVYRAAEQMQLAAGGQILEGRMMPYDEWTEIKSQIEGHFLERFAPGALAETIRSRKSRIRALFEHGLDNVLGRQPIAEIVSMHDEPDGAYYRASLLDGLPALLVAGLRRGLYGSSIRFAAAKFDRVSSPRRSAHNPDRLPEVTVREALVKEFSVVTFPQYAGATAMVRSLTDEVAARAALSSPKRVEALVELLERSARPTRTATRDYLAVQPWRLPDPPDPTNWRL